MENLPIESEPASSSKVPAVDADKAAAPRTTVNTIGKVAKAAHRFSVTTGAGVIRVVDDKREKGSTPLFLAIRMRTLHLDVTTGNIEVGLRVFGFWKSGLDCPEGTVLRQKHGEIPREMEADIPDIQLFGKAVKGDDAENDREIKFHALTILDDDGVSHETDTMVTVFQYRTIEEIFHLQDFPFDEQQLDLQVRLPKSNAKDFHFGFRVSEQLSCEKERIMPRGQAGASQPGHGALELSSNVRTLLSLQWTIISCELVGGAALSPPAPDRAVISIRLRRRHDYYLARMLIPSGVCASLSMTAWNVEHHAFGERAAILVTLFLALVASTTSYAVNLPKLPYLTALDRYLSMCLLFTTLVTVGCVLGTPRGTEAEEHKQEGGGYSSDDVSAALDKLAMIVLTAGWLTYNGWFFRRLVLEQAQHAREDVGFQTARTLGRTYGRLPISALSHRTQPPTMR